jgi:hypothetical protein
MTDSTVTNRGGRGRSCREYHALRHPEHLTHRYAEMSLKCVRASKGEELPQRCDIVVGEILDLE